MQIDLNKIIGKNEIEQDFDTVLNKVDSWQEAIIFNDNRPTHVLMTIEQYEKLTSNIKQDEVFEPKNNTNIEDGFKDLSSQDLAKIFISKFLEDGFISKDEVTELQTYEYSKETFNGICPILKEINEGKEYSGFFNEPLKAYDKEFSLCAIWDDLETKEPLSNWISNKLMEIIMIRVLKLKQDEKFDITTVLDNYFEYIPTNIYFFLEDFFLFNVTNGQVEDVSFIEKDYDKPAVYIKI